MPNETPPPPDNAAPPQAGGLVFPSRVRVLLGLPSAQTVLTPAAPTLAQFPYPGVAVDAGLGQWPPAAEPAPPLEDPAMAADSTILDIPGFSTPKPSPRFEPADGTSTGFAEPGWAVDSTGTQPADANPRVGGSQPAPSPSDDADFYAHLQRVVSVLSGNSKASPPAATVPRTSQAGSSPPLTPAEEAGPPEAATAKLATQPMEAVSLAVPRVPPGKSQGAGKLVSWVFPHPEDPSELLGDAMMEPEPKAKSNLPPPIHPAQQSMASALGGRVEPRPQASTEPMAFAGQADGPLPSHPGRPRRNPGPSTALRPAAAPSQATTLNPVSPTRSSAADRPLAAGQMSGLGNPSPALAHGPISDAKAQTFVPPAAKPPTTVGPDEPLKVSTPPRPGPMSTLVPTATPHPAAMPLPPLRPLAVAQASAETLEEIARLRSELADLAEQLKARQARQKEVVPTPPGKPANPAPAARSSSAFWERSHVSRLCGWNRG